ncbi:hypothetical protein GGI13_004591 [Coemansia sp. RSA 455]|nr:hypothetical protein GGI13_004591 [Coemansia sp. RSA 455]
MTPEYTLSPEQIDSYHEQGFLKITDLFSADQAKGLVKEVRDIQSWPDTPGKWMNYYEHNKHTNSLQLCRTENFTPYNEHIRIYSPGSIPKSHVDSKVIPHSEDGSINDEWCDSHTWIPVECNSGDVLIFGSYLAHKSGENKSNISRANLYMTYNPLSEGDKRAEYYADKREKFPPLNERMVGKDYSAGARTYNFANPIL